MGYFTFLAKQAFGDSPEGERLFLPSGPFARPYVIPTAEVEERLFRKQLWLSRLLIGGVIVLQPVLFALAPTVIESALAMGVYIVGLTLAMAAISWLVLRRDLAGLSRRPARLSIRELTVNLARRNSARTLLLGLLGSLAFVALGVIGIASGTSTGTGWVIVVFFGLCAAAWGYALDLRHEESV